MLRPLVNTFGFETNCYVCDPSNPSGLRIQFYLDDEAGTVTGTASLGDDYQGAPTLVHGGVLAALCDDAMAWAAIALGRRFALTAEMHVDFLGAVPCGREVTISARIIGRLEGQIWSTCEIRDATTVLVRAEARSTVIGDELAAGIGIDRDAAASAPADVSRG